MAFDQFAPPLTPMIDTVTGQLTEIGRIFLRRLATAVGDLPPVDAQYLTATANPTLSNERNLGALASGYLKLAVAIGIATPSTVTAIPQADVTGLVADLAAKATLPIAQADVTGLVAALAAKATLPIAQADVTSLVADLAAKAPLASPALTGTPTAPTAGVGTNTTQLATTAFALANAGAPLASPTFTGVPAAPTAAVGTNTTQLATTAFVLANAGAAWTVLKSGNGTSTAAGGTNVDSVVLPALTANDTLVVDYYAESATQATTTPGIGHLGVALLLSFTGGNLAAGQVIQGRVVIKQRQGTATHWIATSQGLLIGGAAIANSAIYTPVATWGSAWTLSLFHAGVTAGGTFKWQWTVSLLKG